MEKVRVRFAPSPTGPLHIGGLRTALFNYLFARKHKGDFVLRIEDTDQNRFVPGAENYIMESLEWLGISPDESPKHTGLYGPYRQSERQSFYTSFADMLIAKGAAYYAFDSAEVLEELRKNHEEQGKTFIYNWHNREKGKLVNSLVLSNSDVADRIASGQPYVIRFKSPKNRTLELHDLIRGDISIDTNNLDDKILFKSDGMPTYHLANIVDDHLMKISHVIRGEEWLPSLALHILLYEAFGWQPPQFAHLPLILKPTGKGKLSKRDGDKMGFPVFPLEWVDPDTKEVSKGYKQEGYFPETLINFLALLGWNPGTEQEIFSLLELIDAFNLNKVNKSGARFDPDKTKWFNHHYMQEQLDLNLADAFINKFKQIENQDINYVAMVVGLIKERATFVSDFWALSCYFFEAPKNYDAKALKKATRDNTSALLKEVVTIVSGTQNFSAQQVQHDIKEWITSQNISFGHVMMPLRLSLVGELKGPDVFDIIFMIGKDESLRRINNFIHYISSLEA